MTIFQLIIIINYAIEYFIIHKYLKKLNFHSPKTIYGGDIPSSNDYISIEWLFHITLRIKIFFSSAFLLASNSRKPLAF
jgi:hypothetical protein